MQETTRERLHLLRLSFTPQHSGARVLDRLIHKWRQTRRVLSSVLTDKYRDLARTGWIVLEAEIRRDVASLVGGAFEGCCSGS